MSANFGNQSGQLVLRKDVQFNGVKVFSATMVADRDVLGEKVTAWINAHGEKKVTNLVVTQSSDEAFHCIAITVFYYEEVARRLNRRTVRKLNFSSGPAMMPEEVLRLAQDAIWDLDGSGIGIL